jgi:hypothetical protein
MQESAGLYEKMSKGPYTLRFDDRRTLILHENAEPGSGDSSLLQKGLIMLVKGQPVCGEGVGFGVPALEYPGKVFFSTSAKVEARDDELIKYFSIDAVSRKSWKERYPIENGIYSAVQSRLAKRYQTDKNNRSLLTSLMKLQYLLGVKSSFQRVTPRGIVKITYRLAGDIVKVRGYCLKTADQIPKRLLIFNEQSGDFNLYEDSVEKLTNDQIGVWELVHCERACLTNSYAETMLCVEAIPGAELYRGRELLRPRLDWSGFCYVFHSLEKSFCYTIKII